MKNGAKKVTIKDVAREAGASIATVSFVMNNSGSVGREMRARVIKAAEDLGYRGNQMAKTMRTGRSHLIGLVLPDLCNPFFPELAHSVGEAARRRGYAVILMETNDGLSEAEGLERLAIYGVDGICWCPSSKRDLLTELNISLPAVVVDRPLPRHDTVTSNYTMGGKLLADYIQRCGYRSIALVTGPKNFPGTAQRRGGLVRALEGKVSITWECANAFSTTIGDEALAALVRRDTELIVCANDTIAIGVISALQKMGVNVPADVGVVGFDDIPWSVLVNPSVTTIRQPLHAIGAQAVSLLISRIEQPDSPLKRIQVDVELVERGSTRSSAPRTPS
ncbi:LacI family DNA-binding transcriptional regulator [Sphingobium chlorophenolicum]|uniref:Ribose operon repressor n=1 Tax=Sphingobium chlorophenolicum TaxID=46429 RepID=A0A081RF07_SPHCR|nr:LacI family DNA-binding transcriptional regulator [Sphingobium chlorophenolicum]KEQ53780.1 Ribose operon repressor [Sphingobium chlorophenolicum]